MIEVIDVRRSYGQVNAVDGVSFSIEKGEVFGLLGPNGAGKTTTIRMLTTLSTPSSGRCLVGGYDVVSERAAVKELIAVVPQENNLDRELTVYENLLVYAMLHRVQRTGERITELLNSVGLWKRKDDLVAKLSGGLQRRLLLARALIAEPQILFLDEPSVGLDPQVRRHMWDMIRKTKKGGKTVLITTHYIEEAEALCDRVGILSRGSLIALGRPADLIATVGAYVVEVLDHDGRLAQHVCRGAEEAHDLARRSEGSVTVRKSNLEDVFVKLTGERI
ncbi:MAG TPA: ABC transporter ATP-binding protein [Dissulfurispiraceae bacterium]|nr:ABC transporter ATP-binding protein [Dissulfurispiraceae bacterium]